MDAPVSLELPPAWLDAISQAVALKLEEQHHWKTAEGLAAWLGCDVEHVYDLRQRGLPGRRLHHGRPSKKLYFNLREVSAWFEHESIAA